jgi:hypothetical protein
VKIGTCKDVDQLREALSIAVEALGQYEDIVDGQYGPRANTAMDALTQINGLVGVYPISLYHYLHNDGEEK